MGLKSTFDDFPTNFEEEFFDADPTTSSTLSSDDEEQLIRDGNDQVLKNFERRKKNQEYSRTQTSREKKAPELSMEYVDWSGFPGAAHSSPAVTGGTRKNRSERHLSSGNNNASTPTSDSEKRTHSRSHQRKLAAAAEIAAKSSDDPDAAKKEPQKYRNRRHNLKAQGSLSISAHGDSAHGPRLGPRASRRSSLNLDGSNLNGSNHRPAERRHSGSHRPQRRGSATGKTPRSQRTNAHSLSPGGRMRRPVNAAAASTMLEGGRKPPQKSLSGRRLRAQRRGSANGSLLKVADDGVIASNSSDIKW